jgi:hypothetical protein
MQDVILDLIVGGVIAGSYIAADYHLSSRMRTMTENLRNQPGLIIFNDGKKVFQDVEDLMMHVIGPFTYSAKKEYMEFINNF